MVYMCVHAYVLSLTEPGVKINSTRLVASKTQGFPVSAPSSASTCILAAKFYLNDPNPGPHISTETSTTLTEPSSYGPPDNNVFLRK